MNKLQGKRWAGRSRACWAALPLAMGVAGLALLWLPDDQPPGQPPALRLRGDGSAPKAQPIEPEAPLAAQPLKQGRRDVAEASQPGPRAPLVAPKRQVHFEPNRGQAGPEVRYLARAEGVLAQVHDDGITLTRTAPQLSAGAAGESATTGSTMLPTAEAHSRPLAASSVHLRFVGASRNGRFEEREAASGRLHYLVGAAAASWLRDVPLYRQLRRAELYPGIDLVYYSRNGELEYDLVVKAGADPAAVRFRVAGKHPARLARNGDLLLDGARGGPRLKRPVLYQNIDGEKRVLDGRYVLHGRNLVGFQLPAYDRTHPLVIDPTFKLLYSTYLGGVHDDQVAGVALDRGGNAYVVGYSASENFAVSGNAYQAERKALGRLVNNVVVSKFSASGTLLYSTFLGGTTNDFGQGIAVDAAGQAHVTGVTQSADFPTTAGAMQAARLGASSAFVATLSLDGSNLVYSTLFGGTGGANAMAIALDAADQTVIAGTAGPGLPTTSGAFKTTLATGNAAFVARIDERASGAAQLLASTYYGADAPQVNSSALGNFAFAMTLGAGGTPWITGQAYTANLPTTAGAPISAPTALDATCSASSTLLNSFAYVAQLSADLRSLVYASYLSGKTRVAAAIACAEYGHAIAVDPAGNLFVGGATTSNAFPTTAGVAQPVYPGAAGTNGHVSFITKLAPNGSAILWSSYLGGNAGNTFLSTIALDAAANAVWGASVTAGGANFPISADALQSVHGGNFDAAVTQLDAATGALRYSTFMGGSGLDNALAVAIDAYGNAFVGGVTRSPNFPVTSGSFQPTLAPFPISGGDWFFSVLGSGMIGQVRPASGGNVGDVTLRISGAGFDPQAGCTLSGANRTVAAAQAIGADNGSTIHCTFALTGAEPGLYDVSVVNPDGTRFTRSGGFSVLEGGGSDLSVEVVGRSTIRVGVASVFNVVVTNDGDADALGVVLYVRYSAGLRPVDPSLPDPFDLRLIPIAALFPGDSQDYSRNSVVMPNLAGDGASLVPLLLPFVPARGTASFAFRLVAPAGSDEEYVEAFVTDAFADSALELASPVSSASSRTRRHLVHAMATALSGDRKQPLALSQECLKALWDLAWEKASGKIPGVDCLRDFNKAVAEGKIYALSHPDNQATFFGDAVDATTKAALSCVELAGVEISATIKAAQLFRDMIENAANLSEKCKPKDKDKPKPKRVRRHTKAKGSVDPNDKSGPAGDDSAAHFLPATARLPYQIAFENLAAAGLPAAEVVVTDQLDPTKFDLATLTLGSLSWGPYRIDVPPGLNSYSTVFPIDATMSVRVQGSLNPTTGVLKWTFTTLDPATKLPPSDPTLGFLPPNVNGTQGQGYVNFTIAPKAGLPDGTKWENFASIVFDANPPIVTPTWVNTLDSTAPSSRVQALAGNPGTMTFDVAWSGTDSGSGARSYAVHVSDNGGPFTAWLSNTTATSATYTGASGHSYAFYSVATDGAGNTEAAKGVAEASISVNGNFADPSVGSGGGGGCTISADDSRRDIGLPLFVLVAAGMLRATRRKPSTAGKDAQRCCGDALSRGALTVAARRRVADSAWP